jgi:8-oxo-dGTP pyrophosphatase MutT (NUDIX family)
MSATPAPPDGGPNPWRRIASTHVYSNPWIRVREDQVVRPDGRSGIYGVVELRNHALGAVPLFDDGTTVLVGQFRYSLGTYSWEIPEGGGDPGLDRCEEMARELAEETGLRAGRWTALGTVHTSNCVTDEVGWLWLAEDLRPGEAAPEATEVLETWRLPLAVAVTMALDGTLTDSLTVAGLLRAAHMLGTRAR